MKIHRAGHLRVLASSPFRLPRLVIASQSKNLNWTTFENFDTIRQQPVSIGPWFGTSLQNWLLSESKYVLANDHFDSIRIEHRERRSNACRRWMVVESFFKIKRNRKVNVQPQVIVDALDAEDDNALHFEVNYYQEKNKRLFQDEQSDKELVE